MEIRLLSQQLLHLFHLHREILMWGGWEAFTLERQTYFSYKVVYLNKKGLDQFLLPYESIHISCHPDYLQSDADSTEKGSASVR